MKLIGFLVIVVLLLVGLGFALGWWSFSSGETAEGDTELRLKVNRSAIEEDTDEARADMDELLGTGEGEEAGVPASGDDGAPRSLAGRLELLEGGRITVSTEDGGRTTLALAGDAQILLDGQEVEPSALRPGDRVRLVWEEAPPEEREVARVVASREDG